MIRVWISLLILASPAWGQEQKAPPELPPRGTEIFRGLLNFAGIKPYFPNQKELTTLAQRNQIILIVYGAPVDNRNDIEIRTFAGNPTQLIAWNTDYDVSNVTFLFRNRGIMTPGLKCFVDDFTPESLVPSERPNCPFVSSKPYGIEWLLKDDPSPSWNPFRGFGHIATNRPASIGKVISSWQMADHTLAYLPKQCRVGNQRGQILPPNNSFAVGMLDDKTGAPAILMADENVLSNQMIAMPGTDNLPFAMKLIKLLKGNQAGNKYCVFYEYGDRKDKFDDVIFSAKPTPPMPPIPIPPPQMLDQMGTQLANSAVDQLDRSDTFNSLLSKNQRYYAQLLAVIMLGLTAMAFLFFARRAFQARYRADRKAMPIAPLARIKQAKGIVGQMRQDVLLAGDYGPVVREYLRELFTAVGLPGGNHDRLPPIQYKGKTDNAPALLADLTKLWVIAYGPHQRVNIAKWKEIEPMMQRVWRAADAGRWNFIPSSPGAA